MQPRRATFGRALAALALVVTVAFALLTTTTRLAYAQATEPPAVIEDEAPDSPRASMRVFFDLCDRGRYEEAARYLDVPYGTQGRAPELARKLSTIISERLVIDPAQLSPRAHGRTDDRMPAAIEELGKIEDGRGKRISIRIGRREPRSSDEEARWVFTQSTVQNVDSLYASLKGQWLRDRLPTSLLAHGPAGLYYWQLLALPLLALGCVGVGRVLTFLAGLVARRALAKATWGPLLLSRLARPVTTAWALFFTWQLLPYLGLTLRAEDLVERVLSALGYLTFFWTLLRTVTVVGDEVVSSSWAAPHANVRAITSVGVRLGKMVVAVLAFLVALSELGYPVTTVVAGLGIGGVALALAAQKTVEHLFGSLSILVDQPFHVGDVIRVDGIEGTVETIGLRSTRIRTTERTMIIIPNGKLADMRIESLGARDVIRFATRLSIARDASPAQLEALVKQLGERLAAHDGVRARDASALLVGLGESSFDVDVAAPVQTTDTGKFARVREELLLLCVRAVEEVGLTLAVPARRVVSPPADASSEIAPKEA